MSLKLRDDGRGYPLALGIARGLRAALASPRHLEGARLRELLRPPPGSDHVGYRHPVPPLARIVARRAIGGLGRLPGPWLPTCLYRSIAECLLLRAYGVPAYVCLGVRKESGKSEAVPSLRDDEDRSRMAAHAWVRVVGDHPPAESEGYAPLASSSGTWALPADGSLVVRAAAELRRLVEPWAPLTSLSSGVGAASVEVAFGGPVPPAPAEPPTLEMESVRAWVFGDGARLLGRVAWGEVDLQRRRAQLKVARGSPPDAARDELFWLLSLASALLLGRMGRCLVHAGAVQDPEGRVWIVAADGGSGKSTLCANLLRAGWSCLSDDHVVLVPEEDGGLAVEGWLRPLGLDEGWPGGAPNGNKLRVHPFAVAKAGAYPTRGPAGGLLVPAGRQPNSASTGPDPVLRPDRTGAEVMRRAEALPVLVRQSAWLIADRKTAADTLRLLERAAALPAFRLEIGLDAFADARPVLDALHSLAPHLVAEPSD